MTATFERPHGPTVAIRRAAFATAGACALVWTLSVVTTRVGEIHERSPWASGPWASMLSFATVVTPLLVAPTLLRAVVHGGPVAAPPHAARTIVAGSTAAVAVAALAVLGCVVAVVAGRGSPAWDAPGVAVHLLLVAAAGALTLAGQLLKHGRDEWGPRIAAGSPSQASGTGRPDVLDDVATLTATLWPGSLQARLAAWLDRGLDVWSWSPRRHRTLFVGAAAVGTGVLWTGWHGLVEGPWDNPGAPLAFALVTGTTVAAVLAGGIAWLGLLRPAPSPR